MTVLRFSRRWWRGLLVEFGHGVGIFVEVDLASWAAAIGVADWAFVVQVGPFIGSIGARMSSVVERSNAA